MLRIVKWQRLHNARLGHVTLLNGSCMPRFDDSPAVQFVRLGLLVDLGTVVGVYFIYYKLFAVCLCLVLSFDLCLLAVDGKCCVLSLCASTLSWSVCTPGCVSVPL